MRFSALMVIGVALSAAGGAQAQGPQLRMTCHELLQGVPMKEPIIYEVVGPNLFRTHIDGQRLIISASNDRRYLSTSRIKGVDVLSYASHTVRAGVLDRQVFESRRGGPMRLRFTERFDFNAQRYTSSFSSGDQCHHDGR